MRERGRTAEVLGLALLGDAGQDSLGELVDLLALAGEVAVLAADLARGGLEARQRARRQLRHEVLDLLGGGDGREEGQGDGGVLHFGGGWWYYYGG